MYTVLMLYSSMLTANIYIHVQVLFYIIIMLPSNIYQNDCGCHSSPEVLCKQTLMCYRGLELVI